MGTTSIYSALNYIQSNLKAPKGQFNSFGKYHYRSCEDILEGVKPHLKETNTCLVISDEIVTIGDHNYIKATATLYGADGGAVANSAFAKEPLDKKGMDPSQITGATSSYARKYALNGLFCIDDTKDADTDAYTANTTQTKVKAKAPETNSIKEKRIKEEYFNSIKQQMGIKGIDNKTIGEQMMKMFGKQNSKTLSEEELKALLNWATNYEVAS
ncbi:ERF family protein [Veillonella sp. CHU594]|uniref:ERF family protein n=1 Tax=Veillonella sp. CHU594 TaxID=2490948 RepID=UPI000F8D92A3|nr:ERF family protein [Veillonella sp. CHU594]